jgi:hypothetical protein
LAILLFIVNYFGIISRLANINNDWYYLQMQKIQPSLTRNDIVVFKDGWIIKDYVSYFTKSTVVDSPLDINEKAEANQKIRQAIDGGGKLFLFEETNRTNTTRTANYFDSLLSRYSPRARILSKEPLVWVIQ